MATIRSALVRLARRSCGSSRSSAAASMFGGRGPEVHQVFRPSAPSLPLLRPSARNLEGLQRFSTNGMECTDQKPILMKQKAMNVLQLWSQRCSDHVKNYRSSSSYDACVNRSIRVFGTIVCLASLCYLAVTFRAVHYASNSSDNARISRARHYASNSSDNVRISRVRSRAKAEKDNVFCMLPPSHPWYQWCLME